MMYDGNLQYLDSQIMSSGASANPNANVVNLKQKKTKRKSNRNSSVNVATTSATISAAISEPGDSQSARSPPDSSSASAAHVEETVPAKTARESTLRQLVGRVVLPGQVLEEDADALEGWQEARGGGHRGSRRGVGLGPGLVCRGRSVFATLGGVLREGRAPRLKVATAAHPKGVQRGGVGVGDGGGGGLGCFWIETRAAAGATYVPVVNERVIGVLVGRAGDSFRVDIGATHTAMLSGLAFEGVTKRTRPDLHAGDLLWARVVTVLEGDTQLSCVDDDGKANGLGLLGPSPRSGASTGTGTGATSTSPSVAAAAGGTGGANAAGAATPTPPSAAALSAFHVVYCAPHECRALLRWDNPAIDKLGAITPFELVVGTNGRFAVRSRSARLTLALTRALLHSAAIAQIADSRGTADVNLNTAEFKTLCASIRREAVVES